MVPGCARDVNGFEWTMSLTPATGASVALCHRMWTPITRQVWPDVKVEESVSRAGDLPA
jgi:hypothetical protein